MEAGEVDCKQAWQSFAGGVEMSYVLIRVMEIQVYPFLQTQTIHKMGVADCVKIIL